MNYRETPPVPPFSQCVPWGLVGYAERKEAEMLEAALDREESRIQAEPDFARIFIEHVHGFWPQINARAIAESINPWDMEEFRKRVIEAVERYAKEKL